MTAGRPQIYSTFINPVFYEDAYTRWRMDEQALQDSPYDAPWQYSRRLYDQSDNPEIKWSTLSLRAHDNYDYKNFSRIPRGRLSSDSETEYADSIGTETRGLTTF
ncbi:uncharacterized protein LOC112556593 [Pomacea canaliculata]|nr:uncharacterized protein LOC112556593 [Pomacea canaliculata]